MNNRRVMLIEDNEKLNIVNTRALKAEGYQVQVAACLKDARDLLKVNDPEVILLDIMLPDGDGLVFCDEIRSRTKAHIILLTAKREHETLIQGFSLGADDYIKKPYKLDELLGRVASAMRRHEMNKNEQYVFMGNLTLDTIAMEGMVDGKPLGLAPKEFALLQMFIRNEDVILEPEYLYNKVWLAPLNGDKAALKIAVSKLRRKLARADCKIDAVREQGYVFVRHGVDYAGAIINLDKPCTYRE